MLCQLNIKLKAKSNHKSSQEIIRRFECIYSVVAITLAKLGYLATDRAIQECVWVIVDIPIEYYGMSHDRRFQNHQHLIVPFKIYFKLNFTYYK